MLEHSILEPISYFHYSPAWPANPGLDTALRSVQCVPANHQLTRPSFPLSPILRIPYSLPNISSLTSSSLSEMTWLVESRPMVMP